MRLSRSLSGKDLVKALEDVGYKVTRQTGSLKPVSIEKQFKPFQHLQIPAEDTSLSVLIIKVLCMVFRQGRKLYRTGLIR